jgi:hypothetical protein
VPTQTLIPSPTEIPVPEVFSNLLEDFIPIRNEDNTWGIGREVNGETLEIPGIASSESKLTLNLGDENTLDITQDINKIKIIDHPSGALIIDKGERIGYVWKGDHWTEILLQINFETDGTKFNEFPTITYEDIASGALAEAERLAAQPFPEGVEPLNNYYHDLNSDMVESNLDLQTAIEFYQHPEKFPMRYIYFYQTEINNFQIEVATLQVLNKDNTSVFIHMASNRGSINGNLDFWNKSIQLDYIPVFNMMIGGTNFDYCGGDGWGEMEKQICALNLPRKDFFEKMMQKWMTEQKIPGELERALFYLLSGVWY